MSRSEHSSHSPLTPLRGQWHRSSSTARVLIIGALLVALPSGVAAATANAAQTPSSLVALGQPEPSASPSVPSFSFESIALKHVPVPTGFKRLLGPVFLTDGHHIVVAAQAPGSTTVNQIVLSDLSTGRTSCLTCTGGPALPDMSSVIINPFPDGKRLFLGFHGILECAPSLVDCQSYTYLPYDISGAQGAIGTVPPISGVLSAPTGGILLPGGGTSPIPAVEVVAGASPKLSPDGNFIAYSNIRDDGYEEMVIAKLVRQSDKYVGEDARVLNPPGPTSASDPSVSAWSLGGALYELKTFTHGGADLTYVQVGGADAMNPDIWQVNLKTGARERLTSNPDWDEDSAISPDGSLLGLWSNRNYHLIDYAGGLLHYRSFIDAPLVAAIASRVTNAPGNLYCAGPEWLLPAAGDENGQLVGQPIIDYKDRDSRVTDQVAGWPMWNAQSNAIVLQTTSGPNGGVYGKVTPPYLLVGVLSGRKARAPEPVVSSAVGSWAPTPADYHPTYGYRGTVTLKGPGGGTVAITSSPIVGALFGSWSETYHDYSEDGRTFLNGTQTVNEAQPNLAEVDETAHLVMTGAHTGSLDSNFSYKSAGYVSVTNSPPTSTGSFKATYDGTTVTGPPSWIDDASDNCPPSQVPPLPQLKATAKRLSGNTYLVHVSASITGAGANEAGTEVAPVNHALLAGVATPVYTDSNGNAVVNLPPYATSATTLHITAGDTLAPTSLVLQMR